jgi:hypothetical protein
VATGFEVKSEKLSTLVLRLNQETRASHLHVYGADRTRRHPTSRSSGHRVPDLCDHPRSSAPGLLLNPRRCTPWSYLPPAHHETSKRDSPTKQRIKVKQPKCLEFQFKPRKSMTHHNQTKELTTWFFNLLLDESINNKSTKFESRI